MNVLGITGGICGGAALLRAGQVVASVHEERLNRLKSAEGFPWLSVREVLELGGVDPGDVDVVAYVGRRTFWIPESHAFDGWLPQRGKDAPGVLDALTLTPDASAPVVRLTSLLGKSDALWQAAQLARFTLTRPNRKKIARALRERMGIRAPLEIVDHHEAHAWGAYFTAGFPEATVVTMDGGGDGYCSKVFAARCGHLKRLDGTTSFHSIGNYYAYVTKLLGYKAQKHEGKVTGLAAFGEPRHVDVLHRFIDYDAQAGRFVNRGGRMLWPAIDQLAAALPRGFRPEDLAASMQLLLEETVTSYIARWVRRTGIPDVVLSGGVFANVKLNQRIHELPGVETVCVHPGMTDAGLGVGAAYRSYLRRIDPLDFRFNEARLESLYLGRGYSEDEMLAAVRRANVPAIRPVEPEGTVAELLAGGAIVGRFDGREEYGPRALGNRSILYQATDASVNKWLNERLHRTEFMPFAPVTLAESASRCYRGLEGAEYAARFMTITFDSTDWLRREMPAVVHVDGTARPQLIDRATNPAYYRLLKAYEQRTGLNSLVNTSFNMHEEPIVHSPEDAVRAFLAADLDYLSMGPFLAARQEDALPLWRPSRTGVRASVLSQV